MPTASTWTVLGARPEKVRASMLGIVLALLFALQVMTSVPSSYPAYMALFAFCGAGWFTWLAWQAHAAVGLLLAPVALLWLNPLLGGQWFTHQGAPFFLSHSAIALLFGIGAYTFAATEKTEKP